jgi:uncharacterized membrane protein
VVSESRESDHQLIVAQPNRSATWRQNQLFLLVLCAWLIPFNVGLALLGAWVVLPFAGIELLALGTTLYYVNRRQSRRHVIRIAADELVLEKGIERPEQRWAFPMHASSVLVRDGRHHWDPIKLALCSVRERVPVGDFLNLPDSHKLLDCLRRHGLPVVKDRGDGRHHVLRW